MLLHAGVGLHDVVGRQLSHVGGPVGIEPGSLQSLVLLVRLARPGALILLAQAPALEVRRVLNMVRILFGKFFEYLTVM